MTTIYHNIYKFYLVSLVSYMQYLAAAALANLSGNAPSNFAITQQETLQFVLQLKREKERVGEEE